MGNKPPAIAGIYSRTSSTRAITLYGIAPEKVMAPGGDPGPALRGVGGGRGLTAWDAVLINPRITVSDLFVYYFTK